MSRIFGQIPGVKEGSLFSNRVELSLSGVHRPTQAGISGGQKEGADSIVVSGGYEDDSDYGNVIIYTGHGGRSNETKKQVADQQLTRGNLALSKSCIDGLPVRVIRGAHKGSLFGPEEGYRYDGLFIVEKYWKEEGISGYKVWRYQLRKINENDLGIGKIVEEQGDEYKSTRRIDTSIQRIVRNTKLSLKVKELYKYKCQVCGTQIKTSSGNYAEAAHIKPLGSPHNGPDVLSNLLCLCPNHHVMFDYGGFAILPNYDLVGIEGKLQVKPDHYINPEFLKYHMDHFYDEKNREDLK